MLTRHLTWFHALIIASAGLIAYFPALGLGFWTDDYLHLDLVARADGVEFLARIFDPWRQIFWYRPLVGLQWKIAYAFLRGEPSGYHFIQIAYHALNSILLYALARRITGKARVGLIAGLLYATFALPSMTVFWPAVHDPLAGIFALSALWAWLDYLETARREKFLFAHLAFIGAILSKEITVVLPALLCIADRVLIGKPVSFFALMKRYTVFLVIVLAYAPLYLIVATQSVFTQTLCRWSWTKPRDASR
ncbi:MAG: glycosyltransferase family 39 protein [Chloroflexi bacterium]|nr:glycosyltransferase family 39 protein [Chloroflexota bacterium]